MFECLDRRSKENEAYRSSRSVSLKITETLIRDLRERGLC